VKKPASFVLPEQYCASWLGLAASTASTMASTADSSAAGKQHQQSSDKKARAESNPMGQDICQVHCEERQPCQQRTPALASGHIYRGKCRLLHPHV
jgi:hypothetical protein